MGGGVCRRLAVTIVADLNVVVAEITVMSSTSHPSLCPLRKTYYLYDYSVVRLQTQKAVDYIMYVYIYIYIIHTYIHTYIYMCVCVSAEFNAGYLM